MAKYSCVETIICHYLIPLKKPDRKKDKDPQKSVDYNYGISIDVKVLS